MNLNQKEKIYLLKLVYDEFKLINDNFKIDNFNNIVISGKQHFESSFRNFLDKLKDDYEWFYELNDD